MVRGELLAKERGETHHVRGERGADMLRLVTSEGADIGENVLDDNINRDVLGDTSDLGRGSSADLRAR